MATNEIGHRLGSAYGGEMTLGAYRRGNFTPWIPGALIDVWVPCARGDHVTGVPQPHVYFIQTRGDGSRESGSIHCPSCREDLAQRHAAGVPAAVPPPRAAPPPRAPKVPKPAKPLPELPF
jgi:hypothetical protein